MLVFDVRRRPHASPQGVDCWQFFNQAVIRLDGVPGTGSRVLASQQNTA